MKTWNMCGTAVVLAAAMLWLSGCVETDADKRENAPTHEIAKADQYAIDVLETYYLWNEEIEKDLARLDPDTCRMPMEVVKGIRYHEGGKEVDRWTVLTDDLKSFQNSVQGLGITYGYDLQAGRITNKPGEYFLVVCCVSNGGPAHKAGLRRGDIIITLDGKAITEENIYDAFNSIVR